MLLETMKMEYEVAEYFVKISMNRLFLACRIALLSIYLFSEPLSQMLAKAEVFFKFLIH